MSSNSSSILLYFTGMLALCYCTTTPLNLPAIHDTQSVGAAVVVRVPVGRSAVLTCPLQGMGMLVWDRVHVTGAIAIGGVIQAGRGPRYSIVTSSGGGETLNINDIEYADSDVYRCYPFSHHSDSNTIKTNLTVLVAPENLKVREVSPPVQEGNTVHVTGKAISRPAPDISWTVTKTSGESHSVSGIVNDVWNTNGTISRTSEVAVPATRDMYGAVFTCTARISELGYSQTVQLTLDMNVAPRTPVLEPPRPTAVEGTRTFLTCTAADAHPPAQVRWFWEGNPVNGDVTLPSHANGTTDVINKLWVSPTERLNGVAFVCEVNHDVWQANGKPPYRITHLLNVQYKPRVSVSDPTLTVWEGSRFFVTCSFYSNPNVTAISWYKNDVLLLEGGRISVTTENQKSTLEFSTSNKDDTGEYRCEATNSVGSTKGDIVTVLALHSPLCAAQQKTQYGIPIGHQVSVLCRVEALPSALVFFGWSINGSDWIISEGLRDPYMPTVAYSVFNVSVTSDASYGNVTCKAYNGVNEMVDPCVFRIRPPGPAEAPSLCDITDESVTGASIDCHDAYDGGYQASYWLQWRDVATDTYVTAANLTDYDFLVSGLSSGRMYPMRVCASNAVFWQNISCTADFMVATAGSSPGAGSVSGSSYASTNTNIIIGGVVGGVLLICMVAIIVEIAVLRKRDKKRLQEDADLYSATNPALEMRERHPRSPPEELFRRSRSLTNLDDPLYDSADGLRGKLSEEKIKALTRQGERATVVESPALIESSVDPAAAAADQNLPTYARAIKSEPMKTSETADEKEPSPVQAQ